MNLKNILKIKKDLTKISEKISNKKCKNFVKLEFDSIDMIKFFLRVEEKYNIKINFNKLNQYKNINKLSKYINDKTER